MPYNVKSIKSLAKLLDVDVEELVRIEQNPEKYYEPFEKKRGEKSRSIDNPTGELAALQIRIKKFLLCDVDVFRPIATGGVKGHSTKT
ncbi:MAG: hypothetical protein KDC10_15505, partial [Calditrichaeota bacterium]|nr:hypothetical protein [Calditrichota bacterium]